MSASGRKERERPPPPPLQLCILDTRKGQQEGQEAEKVLAFYPTATPADDKASVVGLFLATNAFCSIFSQDGHCEAMHAENSLVVSYQGEPSLWLLLVAQRSFAGPNIRDAALLDMLRRMHAVIRLLHGSVQRLLDMDDSGEAARGALSGVLQRWGDQLNSSKGRPDLHNPLSMGEGLPLLPLSRPLFAGVQVLINRLLIAQIGGTVPVVGAMLLHEHWCVWSTLSRPDTAALYSFASMAMMPAAQTAAHPSLTQRITASLRWREEGNSGSGSVLDWRSWHVFPSRYVMFQESAASTEKEPEDLPKVSLQEGDEQCRVLGLRAGASLLVLLLAERSMASAELLTELSEVALPSLRTTAQSTASELADAKQGHIPGYRYVYENSMLQAVRASPGAKAATLSRESQALTHAVRAQLDGHCFQGDAEVIVRGENDCWIVAKRLASHSVAVVLEGRGQENLLDAAKTGDLFIEAHFEGLLE